MTAFLSFHNCAVLVLHRIVLLWCCDLNSTTKSSPVLFSFTACFLETCIYTLLGKEKLTYQVGVTCLWQDGNRNSIVIQE